MTIYHLCRKTKLNTKLANFILKQLSKRLKQFQMKRVGQTADIMMRLNRLGFLGLRTVGFNHVRINRALSKPFGARKLRRLFLENFNKQSADNLALGFRIRHTVKRRHEAIGCIDNNKLHAHILTECLSNLLSFMQTQKTVVNKDTSQLFTDRFVNQSCSDGGINAAGQT